MKYNWIPTSGEYDISREEIKFLGKPTLFKDLAGEDQTGAAVGQIICDQYFSEGVITTEVEFNAVDIRTTCEILFYYDPETGDYLSIGISAAGSMFGLRYMFNGKFDFYKQSGEHSNIKAKKTYHLEIRLNGSHVLLIADGVEVISYNLPIPTKQTQVGIFCLSQSNITIRKFDVKASKPKAFMVMQFSNQYNELYEDVVKEVINESFELDVIKADEIYGPGIILSHITKHIAESKVIIAEISPQNSNVFYEVGYAHALNKPTILIAVKGTKLPFDVSPFKVLFYENTIAGKKRIKQGLSQHLSSILYE